MNPEFFFTLALYIDKVKSKTLQVLAKERPELSEFCLKSKPVDNVILLLDSMMTNLQQLQEDIEGDQGLITALRINPKHKALFEFLPEDSYITEEDAAEWGMDRVQWNVGELIHLWIFTPESVKLNPETEEHEPLTLDRAVGRIRASLRDQTITPRTLH